MNRARFAYCIAIAVLVALMLPMSAGAISTIVFEGAGADAASIQPLVEAFRAALGNPNNGDNPGPLFTGRREINWDAGGQAVTVSNAGTADRVGAFDAFLNNRGALFTSLVGPFPPHPQNEPNQFVQAPPSGGPQGGLATLFGNPSLSDLKTFSDPRLFAQLNPRLINVDFFVPGTNGGVPATVTGFGAVFSDVDLSANAFLSFKNANGVSLGEFNPLAANNGLSFLGVIFPGELISQVAIGSGNSFPFGEGGSDCGLTPCDFVAMDDFLFREPAPVVPEPTTLLLFGSTMAGLGLAHWRRRRQS
jgi:hypothetical protein